MKLSSTLAGLGALQVDARVTVDLARIAEDAGFDQVVLPEHVVMGPDTRAYPYGPFPLPDDAPWLEPLLMLAAMATATSWVRLGTGVLLSPRVRRHFLPSRSRHWIRFPAVGPTSGVGGGWQEVEYTTSGMTFQSRWQRFDDGLRACADLWTGDAVDVETEAGVAVGVRSLPPPLTPGGPPLWFGVALRPRNLDRIVRFGAGWLPMRSQVADLRAGRAALADAGATHLSFGLGGLVRDVADLPATLARLRREFAPTPT